MFSSLLFGQDTPSATVKDYGSIRFAEQPKVSVTVLPEEALTTGVYEQGQLIVTLRVVSKFPFDALNIDFPPIMGVEQVELAAPRTREVSSYAGDGFVHERSLALFALNPGTLRIPTASVRGMLARGQKLQTAFEDQFAGFAIPVKSKPVGYQSEWWMVSPNVDLEESWSKPLEEIREGDIVTRTITLRVMGVNAQRLPELEHSRTQGIAVRELDATVETVKSGQGLSGILTKSWSLKIEDANVVYISPVSVSYWNSLKHKAEKITVAGHRIEPLAADSKLIANRLLEQAVEKQQAAYTLTVTLLALILIPAVALVVYCIIFVFSISSDYRFAKLFLNARNARDAYRAWLNWSKSQQSQSSEQWLLLKQDLQRVAFSDAAYFAPQLSMQRRVAVRQALHYARSNRLKILRNKFSILWDCIFGQRTVL